MPFTKDQRLDRWVEMLTGIYGNTQNYAKSSYEILSHLTEVTGAFGKMLLKKRDAVAAMEFLPKMFSWTVALYVKMKGASADLEDVLLVKYPRACSYCLENPCKCWEGNKPQVHEAKARDRYHRVATQQGRSLNDFQLMFRNIYSDSWGLADDGTTPAALEQIKTLYCRLVEELAETAEAIRFHHLYPSNFNNEVADYFAWWFALVTNMHRVLPERPEEILAEDLLWSAYPGFCLACGLVPCDCRPGPIRELLSKPSLNELAYIDALTQTENRASYDRSIAEISERQYPVATPIACIRVDVDSFKSVNDDISHDAGDAALRHIATSIRKKVRPRDKVFRVGGDEFALLCQDLSALEAEGMMRRVADMVREKPIRGLRSDGEEAEKTITLSIGIAECRNVESISSAFSKADHAAMHSKEMGKDRITRTEE
jgi:diguanylate cyclase (GGDEF)-like protein